MKQTLRTVRKNLSVHLPTVFKPEPIAPPTSVAEILADFEQKIKHLQAVNDAKLQVIAANELRIVALKAETEAHAIEAARAVAVAGKLQALVS
jgi:hypothetical protein